MSDDKDNQSPPPLESDDEDVPHGELSTSATVPTPGTTTAATPSNTPVVSLFSKVPQEASAKRGFAEAQAAPSSDTATLQDLVDKLATAEMAMKKAPQAPKNKADPEDEDDEDEDDDDEDGEDEDEEGEGDDEYVATKEQMEAVVPSLEANQGKLDALKEEYQKARRELEIKFQGLREEHYKERATLVKGAENDNLALPGFWLDAMQRNSLVAQFIETWDEPALVFLDNVSVEELTDAFGYTLKFAFTKNPFFTNETLTKTLKFGNFYSEFAMPDIDESQGTDIKWNPDQNLTVKIEIVKKKQSGARRGGKKNNQTREIRQEVPRLSFFRFFESRKDATEVELAQMNEEEHDVYQQGWEMDFAIASTFRAKLIPNALTWYLGQADDSDFEEEDDEDEDEDEEEGEFDELEDDDDDDDDDDDQDEDNAPKPKKGGKGPAAKSGKGAKPAGGKEGEQPECKQQ